ncbi:MAG TPA: hypothetical protein VKA25_12045 [Gemmatimonadales bacterium]|nr:hypothetical protein [Gemmatimonadales bacterium]
MDDRTLTLLLRLIHILAGAFWFGSAVLMAGFIVPTVRDTGRDGGRFVQHLMQQRRLPIFLGIAMLLTVLSGLTMYGRTAAATHGSWMGTPPGIAYGLGGLAAILAAITGSLVSGGAGRRMAVVGQSIGPTGPSADQQEELRRLQQRIALGTRLAAVFLAIAAGAMAVARYL